jgi:hypothetical protein
MTRPHTSLTLLCATLVGLGGSLASQQLSAVVPAYLQAAEGDALYGFPAKLLGRLQLLIDRSALGLPRGMFLRELWLRRDFHSDPNFQRPFTGGVLHFHVEASNTVVDVAAPYPEFARNHGLNRLVVFSGEITLEDSPVPAAAPAPWSLPHTVRIPFAVPLVDVDRNFCFDLTVTTVAGKSAPRDWLIDAERQVVQASYRTQGQSCPSGGEPLRALVATEGLRPGATGVFLGRGPTNALVLHALGLSNTRFGAVPLPFDLTAAGAPGCHLYNDWLLLGAAVTDGRPGWPFGDARVELVLPLDANLVGGTVFSQWLLVNPAVNALGIATSHGVEARLEPVMPATSYAMVVSYDAAAPTGKVETHLFPVVRFEATRQ